jgi:hypothetical protein
MNQDYLIQLTLALYRVTDCFPEREPLRYAMRELACRIFAAGISGCASSTIEADLKLLKSYFALAKAQHWIAEENFVVLEKAYGDLGNQGKSFAVRQNKSMSSVKNTIAKNEKKNNNSTYSPAERKQKILDMIQQEEKIALKDLLGKFPGIHKRTLIRDLERLQKEDVIKKHGNGRGTFYFLNGKVTDFDQIEQMVT